MTICQGIKKHQFVHVLDSPGDADLSAYVDFPALKHVVQECAGEYIPYHETNLVKSITIEFVNMWNVVNI